MTVSSGSKTCLFAVRHLEYCLSVRLSHHDVHHDDSHGSHHDYRDETRTSNKRGLTFSSEGCTVCIFHSLSRTTRTDGTATPRERASFLSFVLSLSVQSICTVRKGCRMNSNMQKTKKLLYCKEHSTQLYSAANDPWPQMIPGPQMIPKLDRKWSRNANDPRRGPQMKIEKWHGVWSSDRGFSFYHKEKQVIAFDEVERKPNFVAWLCRVSIPV